MKKTNLIAVILLSAALAACGPGPQQQQQPDIIPAPQQGYSDHGQQIPQAQADGFDGGDAALGAVAGAAAGYMLGKGSATQSQPRTIIVERTRPVYVNNRGYGYNGYNKGYKQKTTTTVTTTKRGMFGGTKTTTVTKTKSRRR